MIVPVSHKVCFPITVVLVGCGSSAISAMHRMEGVLGLGLAPSAIVGQHKVVSVDGRSPTFIEQDFSAIPTKHQPGPDRSSDFQLCCATLPCFNLRDMCNDKHAIPLKEPWQVPWKNAADSLLKCDWYISCALCDPTGALYLLRFKRFNH